MKINKNNYEIYVLDFLEGNLSEELIADFELFLIDNPDIQEEIEGLNEVVLPNENFVFEGKNLLWKKSSEEEGKIDLLLAKKLEGDLSKDETFHLDKLLSDNEYAQEAWRWMQKTVLAPEMIEKNLFSSLKFPDSIDYSIDDNLIIGKLEGDLDQDQLRSVNEIIIENSSAYDYFCLTRLSPDTSIVFPDKSALKRSAMVVPMWKKVMPLIAVAAMLLLGIFFFEQNKRTPIAKSIDVPSNHHIERPVASKQQVKNLADDSSNLQNGSLEGDKPAHSTARKMSNKTPKVKVNSSFAESERYEKSEKPRRYDSTLFVDPLVPIACTSVVNAVGGNDIVVRELHVVNIDRPSEKSQSADEYAAVTNNKNYQSFREFAVDKAKETLWGNDDYPEDNYSVALIEKTVEKVGGKESSLPLVSKDAHGWEVKFKRFGIQRKKS